MAKPVSVLDVANYILDRTGRLTTWKLQKLCYYSQAWSLVWDDEPLFNHRVEAWANGPVIPWLYRRHQGRFYVSSPIEGADATKLNLDQRETVVAVLETYGDKSSQWLSELTHSEAPWVNARRRAGLAIGERGQSEILLDDMSEYYGGLYDDETP